MNELKREKKTRSKKNALFNPYVNGICSYDLAYLSSKRIFKNKAFHMESNSKKEYFAA